MKVVAVLLATLVVAYAAPQKRFFIHDIENAFNHLTHQLQLVFNTAKDQFNNLVHGHNVDFDNVVQLLITLIDSDPTEGACKTACLTGAVAILGPAAPLAGLACGPACNAALAKIEELAG